MPRIEYYISLIYKELKGIITEEELLQLNTWEAKSPQNHVIAAEIRNVWEVSEQYELPFELDYTADFEKVNAIIQKDLKSAPTKTKVVSMRSRSRRRWLNIAAAFALLLGTGLLLKNISQSSISWINVTASHEIQEIQLEDGSKIWLNKGSTLSYPKSLVESNRPVKLDGEAFFEVAKNIEKPFQVFTKETIVTVQGTAFNVNAKNDASITEVTVREGKVQVEETISSKKVILTANEKVIYHHHNKQFVKTTDNNLNGLVWQSKRLKFQNNTLLNVFSTIANHYDIKIQLPSDSKIKNCKISGRYKIGTNVEDLLNDITAIYKMKIKRIDEKSYVLEGGICQ